MSVFRFTLLFLAVSVLPAWGELPYARYGWEKEEAAAHLLSRFTYGARPGEVDQVAAQGLEAWLSGQLEASLSETRLEEKLASLPPAYRLSAKELLALYPPPGQVRKMADQAALPQVDGRPNKEAVAEMLQDRGLHAYSELGLTLFGQRLFHARYSENQLREVLTDFWFNHFNVALSNGRARDHLLSYERDAIRPNSLGNFRTLLGATAKHPAMLLYLDNANSTAAKDSISTTESRMTALGADDTSMDKVRKNNRRRKKGLNENYARELMELHTLGVDGGYTQQDVVEVARAFTGWTITRAKDGFRFAPALHDADSKLILGHPFAAGGGQSEGERVLDLLASHPSTAHHIAKKMAVRFISDQPDESDIKIIAEVFDRSRGDIKSVMLAVAGCPGFWSPQAREAKVKSPLELVVSASRALQGDLYPSRPLYGWLAKMGQPLYNYQAPTGFPDQADFWVSSATVLNRVNFALQAARGMVPGFTYSPLPSTPVPEAVSRLMPYGVDRAKTVQTIEAMIADSQGLQLEPVKKFEARPNLGGKLGEEPVPRMTLQTEQRDTATTIGLILGTPAFQRR